MAVAVFAGEYDNADANTDEGEHVELRDALLTDGDYELLPNSNADLDVDQTQPMPTLSTCRHSLFPSNGWLPLPSEGHVADFKDVRQYDRTAELIAVGACLFQLFYTWFTTLWNNPLRMGWFCLHPLGQSLAVAFFTYGILTLQPTPEPKGKVKSLQRHQIYIFFAGLPTIFIGTMAVIIHKFVSGKTHFRSFHAIIGLAVFVWILIQIAVGGGSVWFGGALFGGGGRAKRIYKYHRLSGYTLYILLWVTCHLGGQYSHWSSTYTLFPLRTLAYTICPIIVVGAVAVRIRLSKMRIFPTMPK